GIGFEPVKKPLKSGGIPKPELHVGRYIRRTPDIAGRNLPKEAFIRCRIEGLPLSRIIRFRL
ncbi:hypothetical protein N9242_03305, partial [Vicingaceae bacterium]|nr:hypothetical protein [Vicingaceae bacterium]